MRILCNYTTLCGLSTWIICGLAFSGCGLGRSLDGYTEGPGQDGGAAAAGSGGFGGGGTARGGSGLGGNADAGGTGTNCEEGDNRCIEGVYHTCVDGKLKYNKNCAAEGKYCSTKDGCVETCNKDDLCKNYEDEVYGEFCRTDGRCSPRLFETVWVIPSDGYTLVLPYFDGGGKGNCNFRILWGDEPSSPNFMNTEVITDCKTEANRTHKYDKAGLYHVKIVGTYDGWGSDMSESTPSTGVRLLSKVVSFGPVGLTQYAFMHVGNVELPEKDIPDSSKWTNAKGLFYGANIFNRDIEKWDVSKVTNMNAMFWGASEFNQPLDKWDVSKVKDMSYMFREATTFNRNINNWDVQNVQNMTDMFLNASEFNQPLDKWNVYNVKSMNRMFYGAEKFDQDLSEWTLNENVTLTSIFFSSGMSKDNYCKVKGLAIWNKQDLGASFDCSP